MHQIVKHAIEFALQHPKLLFCSVFLCAVSVYLLAAWQVGSVIWGDSHYYYATVRSVLIDRDVLFANEAYHPQWGFPNEPYVSEKTGRVGNQFSPGTPLMWVPGFLVGQFLSWVVQPGWDVSLDGYGMLTQGSTAVWSISLILAGFWFVWLALQARFSKQSSGLSALFLLVSTQLLYYTFLDPLNSHTAEFFLSSVVFWLLMKQGELLQIRRLLLLGGAVGWLVITRNQHLTTALVVFSYLLTLPGSAWERVRRAIVAGIPAGVFLLLQLAMVWYLYGQFQSPYVIGGSRFYWFQPDFLRVLFSPANGFFFFAPAMTAAVWGLVQLAKKKEQIAWLGLTIFLLQLYVIASWMPEIVGGPYGSRMFTGTLPWLGLGGAWVLEQLSQRLPQSIFWKIVTLHLVVFFGNNLLQIAVMLSLF